MLAHPTTSNSQYHDVVLAWAEDEYYLAHYGPDYVPFLTEIRVYWRLYTWTMPPALYEQAYRCGVCYIIYL